MQSELEDRSVVIEANVEKDYEPDMFRLEIEFEGERPERAACVDTYNADYAKVCEAIVRAGISADEIKCSSFRVSVHYEWLYEKDSTQTELYRRRERIADGYEYRGECSLEHKFDYELLADIWSVLQQIDADFSFDISYGLEKPDECEKELLRTAVTEAKSRAEVLVGASEAKLGDVAAIHYRFNHASSSHSGCGACPPMGDYCYEKIEVIAPEFNPEPISVRCSVSVAWSLE